MDILDFLPTIGGLQKSSSLLVYCCISVVIISIVSSAQAKHQRIRELGTYASIAPYRLPFGLDLTISFIRCIINFQIIEWTQERLQNGGHTVELHLAGSRLVMTDDPDNFKAIMSTQFSNFEKGDVFYKSYHSILGDSIFATDGQLWQASKEQLLPFLSKSRPTDLEITEEHVALFIKHLKQPGLVDVYNMIDRLQLDVVTHIFCGESANSLVEDRQRLRDAVDTLLLFNTVRVVLGQFGLLFSDTVFAPRSTKELDTYFKAHVEKAMSMGGNTSKEQADDKVTLMKALALRQDPKEIKNQLTAVLLAGKDPVSITLSWAFYELARHSQVVKKLKKEIKTIVGPGVIPDETQLKLMPYLKNVVRETVRLHHPIGFNIRQAARDTTLPVGGGPSGKQPVGILRGTQVAYSTIGLHRRHDLVGDDADEWKPERWETWHPGVWEYVPFNHGPRVCIGRAFGQLQMEYIIVRVLQEFESIEYCGREQRTKFEMNTKMAYPNLCRFHLV